MTISHDVFHFLPIFLPSVFSSFSFAPFHSSCLPPSSFFFCFSSLACFCSALFLCSYDDRQRFLVNVVNECFLYLLTWTQTLKTTKQLWPRALTADFWTFTVLSLVRGALHTDPWHCRMLRLLVRTNKLMCCPGYILAL